MGIALKIIGALWMLIGLGDLIWKPCIGTSFDILTFGLIYDMLLFVLPGAAVYGIGVIIDKKQDKSKNIAKNKSENLQHELSIEERLNKLNSLKEKGLINETEYENLRAEILKDI